MSELKATTVYDAYWKAASNGDSSILVYLKSEADKVIAEKENKLQNVSELLKETRAWLIESQKMHKRCADNAIKKLRHQKFKRCLSMARWCMTEYIQSKCLDFTNTEQWYWRRWHIRWRKLANKFKEAK